MLPPKSTAESPTPTTYQTLRTQLLPSDPSSTPVQSAQLGNFPVRLECSQRSLSDESKEHLKKRRRSSNPTPRLTPTPAARPFRKQPVHLLALSDSDHDTADDHQTRHPCTPGSSSSARPEHDGPAVAGTGDAAKPTREEAIERLCEMVGEDVRLLPASQIDRFLEALHAPAPSTYASQLVPQGRQAQAVAQLPHQMDVDGGHDFVHANVTPSNPISVSAAMPELGPSSVRSTVTPAPGVHPTLGSELDPNAGDDLFDQLTSTLPVLPFDHPTEPHLESAPTHPGLQVRAFTEGAYESEGTYTRWADEEYSDVCNRIVTDPQLRLLVVPPIQLEKTMARRLSNGRTGARQRCRSVIPMGYDLILQPHSRRELKRNRRHVEALLPSNFISLGLVFTRRQFEHPAIETCAVAIYFSGEQSPGTMFPEKFGPALPLPAVAFVLTMMQVCLEEWSSGRWKHRDLRASEQLEVYESYLESLIVYEGEAPTELLKFRQNWFKAGTDAVGLTIQSQVFCQPVIRAKDVRPDSASCLGTMASAHCTSA
ncbi:hypothetical protein RSOL_006830, partial [Rhizoctonia solani AG-3 Rhs1AP]